MTLEILVATFLVQLELSLLLHVQYHQLKPPFDFSAWELTILFPGNRISSSRGFCHRTELDPILLLSIHPPIKETSLEVSKIALGMHMLVKPKDRKGRRSDSVLWQKPIHQQKCKTGKVTTQTTLQIKIDYTAVADRLRTVSWSNYGHPTGVVNLIRGLPRIYAICRVSKLSSICNPVYKIISCVRYLTFFTGSRL